MLRAQTFKCNQEKQIIGNVVILAQTYFCFWGWGEVVQERGREWYCRDAGKRCKILGLYGITNKNSKHSITHRALAVLYNVLGTLGIITVLATKAEAQKCWLTYFLPRILGYF